MDNTRIWFLCFVCLLNSFYIVTLERGSGQFVLECLAGCLGLLGAGGSRFHLSLRSHAFTVRTRARVRARVGYCVFINKGSTLASRVTELAS